MSFIQNKMITSIETSKQKTKTLKNEPDLTYNKKQILKLFTLKLF